MKDGGEQPIAFTSRTLSFTEQKYSQIEKEALSIVFSVKGFHQYLHGLPFLIQSDHKPLQFLFNENRQTPILASSRIQRWALTLGSYQYNIQHRPGIEMCHADAMSRLPLPEKPESVPCPGDLILLTSHLSEHIMTADKIRQLTDKDPLLSRVRRLILHGWPDNCPDPEITPYYRRMRELSVLAGCVLWGSRVVIPPTERESLLKQLHAKHPGIGKMKGLAHSYIWWPGLDANIESLVQECSICQLDSPMPPLHPWEWSHRPWWSRLHIDHAGPYLGHLFLVIIDSYSKWIESYIVPSTSSESTIKVLRRIFSSNGIPDHIVSDNGTSFTSLEFKYFLANTGIRHTLTPPYHPSSNGLAKRAVQTIKHGLSKLTGPMEDRLTNFLFMYRLTPQSTTGLSPSELLMGRKIRCKFDLIHPDVSQKAIQLRDNQISKGKSVPRSFKVGDKLLARNFRDSQKWSPVIVTEIAGPQSYKVKELSGRVSLRHVDHLRKQHFQNRESPVPTTQDTEVWTSPNTPFSGNTNITNPTPSLSNVPIVQRSNRTRRPVERYSPVPSH